VVLNVQDKRIIYYDSLGLKGDRYLEGILKLLQDEAKERNFFFDVSEWTMLSEFSEDCHPQVFFNFFNKYCSTIFKFDNLQTNSVDCGVFVLMFADFLSDNLPIREVTEDRMPTFRKRIAANILKKEIPYSYPDNGSSSSSIRVECSSPNTRCAII